jgi:hypothetical protein
MIGIKSLPLLALIPQRKQASFFTNSQNFLEVFLQQFVTSYNDNASLRNTLATKASQNLSAANAFLSTATTNKSNIESSQRGILSSANIPQWQADTTYIQGYLVYSPMTLQVYKAQRTFTSGVDPSLAPYSDWKVDYFRVSGAKTRPKISLVFDKAPLLDKRLTFSRASTGRFINKYGVIETAAVNTPRFESRGDGSPAGILIEKASENLALKSETFSSPWVVQNSSITLGGSNAPDGVAIWSYLKETATTAVHSIQQTFTTPTSTTQYTFSVYVKAADRFRVGLSITGNASSASGASGADRNCVFNLSTGLVEVSPTEYSPCIEKISDYYRISITFNAGGSGATTLTPYIYSVGDTTSQSFLGDILKGVYIFGAQLEVSPSATSYIPTNSTTVTRSADSLFMNIPGFSKVPFSVFAGMSKSRDSSTGFISLGSPNCELPWMRLNPYSPADLGIYERSVTLGGFNSTKAPSLGTQVKFAASIAESSDICIDKESATISTPGILSTIDQIRLSHIPINGHLQFLFLWDTALSLPELKALCS